MPGRRIPAKALSGGVLIQDHTDHVNTPHAQRAAPVRVAPSAASPVDGSGFAALARETDAYIGAFLREARLPDSLREAVEYSALAPGKRLRPVLALLACESVGSSRERALPAAAALELIHAFSLVHDDLPAMDDDDLRRGRPTAHVRFGEAMAILSGDAMLSLAFQALGEQGDAALAGTLTLELSRGTSAMIAGQVYDTLGGVGEGLSDHERLVRIHAHKTGALIRAACRMGAICGMWPDIDENRLHALSAYGDAIGLMFQIVDDILDVEQTSEHLGKRTNKDETAGKATYPGLLGLDASRAEVERLRRAAAEALAPLSGGGVALTSLADGLAVRTK
ncbi:MAG: polyprenyl synthetase family protein [Phycisphaerales bacterium]|nr:MAG: polyprenyl synthetase family protein [Phycisphaerales bacterium]